MKPARYTKLLWALRPEKGSGFRGPYLTIDGLHPWCFGTDAANAALEKAGLK